MENSFCCVILAGGKSSRMGIDKSLLPFLGFDSMTEYQIDKFKNHFEKIYISTKDKNRFNFKANFIEDLKKFKDSSPLIGLLSIFEQIDSEYIFILSVDTPFFGINEFKKLFYKIDGEFDAIVAKCGDNFHNTCAIYRRTIIPSIQKMLSDDNHKLKFMLNCIKTEFVEFSEEEVFLNLNYPEDYKKALEMGKNYKK